MLLLPSACMTTSADSKTPVEIWRGSDDGLTNRFADSLEAAFGASPDFSLSSGKKPGTLVVTIPTNVRLNRPSEQSEVTYFVEFTDEHKQSLGSSRGSCLETRLADCTAHVLVDARSIRIPGTQHRVP